MSGRHENLYWGIPPSICYIWFCQVFFTTILVFACSPWFSKEHLFQQDTRWGTRDDSAPTWTVAFVIVPFSDFWSLSSNLSKYLTMTCVLFLCFLCGRKRAGSRQSCHLLTLKSYVRILFLVREVLAHSSALLLLLLLILLMLMLYVLFVSWGERTTRQHYSSAARPLPNIPLCCCCCCCCEKCGWYFVLIGDVVVNVVCFVCFVRERGRGGRVVLVQPDLPQTLVRRS